MIVQVIFFVKVGRHNDLITVAPQTGGELHSDLVRHFGRRLAGGERLIAVVGHRPVFFAEPLFHGKHFITGSSGGTVDTAYKSVNDGAILIVDLLRFSELTA